MEWWLLEHLEQDVDRGFGEAIRVLDHHDVPGGISRDHSGSQDEITRVIHSVTQRLRDHQVYVGMAPREGRTADGAHTAALIRALQGRGKGHCRGRASGSGRSRDEPRVGHRGRIRHRMCQLRDDIVLADESVPG